MNRVCGIHMFSESRPYTACATTIEDQLRACWAELLGIEPQAISAQSDFFSLGGNSMLLLSLHAFMTEQFGSSLLPVDLIENPTLCVMAELVRRANCVNAACDT